jgi:3-methyladenine DNA glycosylase AlkD
VLNRIIDEIKNNASGEHAAFHRRMIQSDDGYGKGDIVIGCRIPTLRKIAKKYCDEMTLENLLQLLRSKYHEVRSLALMLMVQKFQFGDEKIKKQIIDMYLTNTQFINNWDLVDMSSYRIVGVYFEDSDQIFDMLSSSQDLWENRIAIVATLAFIKSNKFDTALRLCEKFMKHDHHLIHKACGWMLREVGKRNENILVDFLRQHHRHMPRIMQSYAKERLKHVSI